MKKVLFHLLQIGLRTKSVESLDLSVFYNLKPEEWIELRSIAEKQGVAAIVFDGVCSIVDICGRDFILSPTHAQWWQSFILEWTGISLQIEQNNAHQLFVTKALAGEWASNNCKVMVMKGQANGLFYPKPEHRTAGDVDCYLFEDYSKGNEIARKLGASVNEEWYKHSEIRYKGELFENHHYFVHTRGGRKSKEMEKELEEHLQVDEWACFPDCEILQTPPMQWNAMFLTYHSCAHFLSEGLNLKQLLDWAMFLNNSQDKVDWSEFYSYCERYHFKRFVDAVTAICVQYLNIKVNNPKIVYVSSYSERILNSIFNNDQVIIRNGGWSERFQILRNLFINRWKYKEIYQQSVWKQFWWYFSGYLFKTEE